MNTVVQHNFDISLFKYRKISHTKKCIKLVQATASRNLKGYSFVPILDSLTKCAIESKLSSIVTNEIDAKLPLSKIPPIQRREFGNEGLLFDRHPSIESVVPDSKWKEGCSIYYKKDLSQVIWINAEDHIQFFITQRNSPDVKQACELLFSKLRLLEASIPVCHNDNLGYITCNPQWLGSALRIKVIIKLRRSADNQVKYEQLQNCCNKYKVEVRRIMQNTYEFISAKCFQQGKTESDIVNELLICMNELLLVEETAYHLEEKLIDENRINEEAKEMPKFEELNTSLIRAFINKDTWSKYCQLKTSFGHTFKDCISPGVVNHKIGLIALDSDCYDVFEDIFMSIIKAYHVDYKPVKFSLLEELPDTIKELGSLKCVVDGYLMWQGNAEGISFPAGLTMEARKDCSMRLLSFLHYYYKKYEMKLVPLYEDKEVQNNLYFTDIIAEKDKIRKLNNNWPEQRKLIKTNVKDLVLITNVLNHVAIISKITPGNLVKEVINFFDMINSLVIKHMSFWSFSEKFGFQETLPTDIGNGLTIKVVIKLAKVDDIVKYLPLIEPKGFGVNIQEKVVQLTYKHKFKSMTQCFIDTLEVINTIEKDVVDLL